MRSACAELQCLFDMRWTMHLAGLECMVACAELCMFARCVDLYVSSMPAACNKTVRGTDGCM